MDAKTFERVINIETATGELEAIRTIIEFSTALNYNTVEEFIALIEKSTADLLKEVDEL